MAHAFNRPLYGQVRDVLLARIGKGQYSPGDPLPNELALANEFDVSIGTVRRAYDELQHSGIVVRKQGRGTYLTGQGTRAVETRFTSLRSLSGGMLELQYELLNVVRRVASPAEQSRLMGRETLDIFDIRQRVLRGGTLLGIEQSQVPVAMFPELERRILSGRNLYALYSELGTLVTWTEEKLQAKIAMTDYESALGVSAGQPTIYIERVSGSLDLRRVELRTAVYNAALVAYHITT